MIARTALLATAFAFLLAGCTDDNDAERELPGREGVLDDGGLNPALLTLEDLGDGWIEPSVDPPHGSAAHFFCMPTSVETVVAAGVSAGFDKLVDDLETPQPPNIGQSILRYEEGAEAAMAIAPVTLTSCLTFSSLGPQAEQELLSLTGIGDERYGVVIESEMTFTVQQDGEPEREVDQAITSYTAYVRRGDVIVLLMANEIEQDEFERLVRLADQRLQELD